MYDLTWAKKEDLASIDWSEQRNYETGCKNLLRNDATREILFGYERISIREWSGHTMIDFKRSRRKQEIGCKPVGGLPKRDRRQKNKKAYGESNGEYIGFMDDLTPCRVKKGAINAPWFRLNNPFMDCRKTRCFSGPPDQKGYVASDVTTGTRLFMWFALGRTFATHNYPMWVDADEMWPLNVPKKLERRINKLCFSVLFSENECIEAVFPANNPVRGVKELAVSNPMTPLNESSYWSVNMAQYFSEDGNTREDRLVASVVDIFLLWKQEMGQRKEIFVDYERPYFIAAPVLTIDAGLIQIKDYAKETSHAALLAAWRHMQGELDGVKTEFREILSDKDGINYFGVPKEFVPNSKFDNVLQLRLAIAGTIIDELDKDKTLGRIKLAKVFYLIDQNIVENLETKYIREAAGPLDQRLLYNEKIGIEALGNEYDYFYANKRPGSKGQIQYKPGPNLKNLAGQARKLFGHDYFKITNVIDLLRPLDTAQCEIVATLYACWNDLLLSKKQSKDLDIINEFRNKWHMKKKRFSENRLQKALSWMKDNGLVPTGNGKHTSEKS